MTGRSSLGRPVIVASPLCAPDPRCHSARGLAAADRACCGLVDSGSAGFAGGRVLAPRAPRPEHPGAVHPAMQQASHVTPQRLASRANQARARGLQVLTSRPALPVHVPLIPRIDRRIQKPAHPENYLGMAPMGPLDQRSCPERKRGAERSSGVIGGSVLPRKARGHAATRIAPGICVSAGADADCRQSTELEPGALSWGQLLARAESAPPLPRSAGPTEAPPSRTIRSDVSHPDPSCGLESSGLERHGRPLT